MFCFNIPLCNPTEAADIVFSKFNACAVLIYCFRFLAWTFNHKMSSLFLFCFEVVNQQENYKRTTFYCEMLSSRMGCSRVLTLAHAHALHTLCSRFAHARRIFFESFRFLLSPYIRGSFWVHTRVCSRFAHGLLALLTLCSCFAHALGADVSILMKKPISKPCHFFVVPSHVYLKHTAFRLQTP